MKWDVIIRRRRKIKNPESLWFSQPCEFPWVSFSKGKLKDGVGLRLGPVEGSVLTTIISSSIFLSTFFCCCFCSSFSGLRVMEGSFGLPHSFMMLEFLSLWNRWKETHILPFSTQIYWPYRQWKFLSDFYDITYILGRKHKKKVLEATAWCFFITFLNINNNVLKCSVTLRQWCFIHFLFAFGQGLENKFAHTFNFGSLRFGIQMIWTQFSIHIMQPLHTLYFSESFTNMISWKKTAGSRIWVFTFVLVWLSHQPEVAPWDNAYASWTSVFQFINRVSALDDLWDPFCIRDFVILCSSLMVTLIYHRERMCQKF